MLVNHVHRLSMMSNKQCLCSSKRRGSRQSPSRHQCSPLVHSNISNLGHTQIPQWETYMWAVRSSGAWVDRAGKKSTAHALGQQPMAQPTTKQTAWAVQRTAWLCILDLPLCNSAIKRKRHYDCNNCWSTSKGTRNSKCAVPGHCLAHSWCSCSDRARDNSFRKNWDWTPWDKAQSHTSMSPRVPA